MSNYTIKTYAIMAVLLLPLDAFAQRLRLTVITEPPGGTVYQAPSDTGEPTHYIGVAPHFLEYKIPRRWKGCLRLRALKVRWLSGAESGSVDIEACATNGKHQQFVFMRPTTVPGMEIDAQYAIALLNYAQSAANAATVAEAAARPIYLSSPPAPINIPRAQYCTARVIGNQIFTTCF